MKVEKNHSVQPKVKLNRTVPGQVARWVRSYYLEKNIKEKEEGRLVHCN